MSAELRLSDDFAMPLDAVVQKMGVLGRSGTGKTNTVVDIVEELLTHGQQVVILDPPGAWWGLRSSADGKHDGFPVVVLGGLHGDVPLEPTAGLIIADLVVDEHLSAVIDLSEFTDGQISRFVAAFAERLYARKNKSREPMMLVLEEADEMAPQNLPPARDRGESSVAMMLHHIERIAKRGRMRGIGLLVITQRSAALNKHVLSQIEVLITMQTTAPQDIGAINDWVKDHGDQEKHRQLLAEIAGLPVGTGFVWSPSWLRVFRKVAFRKRRTFDSSATPAPGKVVVPPKRLAAVDLAALQKRMAATIEKVKADDPVELRRQLADLQRRYNQLERAPTKEPATTEQLQRLEQELHDARNLITNMALGRDARLAAMAGMRNVLGRVLGDLDGILGEPLPGPTAATPPLPRRTVVRPPLEPAAVVVPPMMNGDAKLGGGERKVLAILAQYPEGRTMRELAFLAGYSTRASTLAVVLSKLRKVGYVERSGLPSITQAGLEANGPVATIPSGTALLDYWRQHPRMGGGERKVFEVLLEHYPEELSHEELCELAGYSPAASTLAVVLSKLRKLGLVDARSRRLATDFWDAVNAT